MKLVVSGVDFFISEARTRLPFRFGAVTMERAATIVARARIESEAGPLGEGFSSDLLVPKWFDKNPDTSIEEDRDALIASSRAAGDAVTRIGRREHDVFGLWHALYRERVAAVPFEASDRLVRGFGVALVERALMDAACRAAGVSFFRALKDDLFGFRPGECLPELAGFDLASSLPDAPLDQVDVRHTIGILDRLRHDDPSIPRIDDGFPEVLEEDIDRYGVRVFKIKIGSGPATDVDRLLDIARFLEEKDLGGARFSLDGNEQFENMEQVANVLDTVASTERGAAFLDGLLHVEQPLHRTATFDAERCRGIDRVDRHAPVILDEADAGIEAFPLAIDLGYRGISVKNCKGVFRALLNRGICEARGDGLFQAAEDLTNLPVLALQQDLATVAALGLTHVERNGHHYFRGLDHLPSKEAERAAAAHPDLYRRTDAGLALDIREGRLRIGSLDTPGYGTGIDIDIAARTPVEPDAPLVGGNES